jgi:hypothetical protein
MESRIAPVAWQRHSSPTHPVATTEVPGDLGGPVWFPATGLRVCGRSEHVTVTVGRVPAAATHRLPPRTRRCGWSRRVPMLYGTRRGSRPALLPRVSGVTWVFVTPHEALDRRGEPPRGCLLEGIGICALSSSAAGHSDRAAAHRSRRPWRRAAELTTQLQAGRGRDRGTRAPDDGRLARPDPGGTAAAYGRRLSRAAQRSSTGHRMAHSAVAMS